MMKTQSQKSLEVFEDPAALFYHLLQSGVTISHCAEQVGNAFGVDPSVIFEWYLLEGEVLG